MANTKNTNRSKELLGLMFNQNRTLTFLWVLLSILAGMIPSSYILLNKILIDNITSMINSVNVNAIWIVIIIAIIGLLEEGVSGSEHYIYQKLKLDVGYQLESKLFSKIIHYPVEHFESNTLYNKLMIAYQAIQNSSIDIIKMVVRIGTNLVKLISMLVVLTAISWYLPLAMAIAAIPSTLGIIVIKKNRYRLYKSTTELMRKNSYFSSLFFDKSSVKESKIFDLSRYFLNKWKESKISIMKKKLDILLKEKVIHFLGKSVVQVSVAITSLFLINLIARDEITIGSYVSLTAATTMCQTALASISEYTANIYEMKIYINALFELLEQEDVSRITHKDENSTNNEKFESMELRDVSFQYPQGHQNVLKNVNLKIKKGDKIAIVGHNGCGKTTLVNVILGLFESYSGEILVNEVLSSNVNRKEYFELFSCIMQDFMRYDFTLLENIGIGNLEEISNESLIKNKMREVELNSQLSNKLDKVVSIEYKDGFELSGGEWQKVAIARALMKDSDVIVFDEPTASLDPISEKKVFELLNSIIIDKTSIIVSHRLGITRGCNKIVVMDEGQVVELGTHDELMSKKGVYYSLYRSQAKWYDPVAI